MKKYFLKLTAAIAALAIMAMNMPMLVSAAEAATASTFTGENLLADWDPDFTGSSLSAKWNTSSSGTLSIDTATVKSGTQSVKSVRTSGQVCGPKATGITVEAGKSYYVSAWVYPSSSDSLVRVRFLGSESWKAVTANTWNHVREVVHCTTSGTADFYVQSSNNITNNTAATVYVDDLELMEVGTNLLSDRDPDFETRDITLEATDSYSSLWNIRGGTVANDTAQKKSGLRSVKITSRTGQQCGPMAENVAVEAGKTYYASAWVYSDKATKYRLRFHDNASSANLPQTALESVPANRWTCLGAVIECKGNDTAYFYVQAADATTATTVYVDNFELYDFTPPAPAATTVASPLNGAEKVSVNTDLKLVFSQAVNGVTASNIEISGATVGTITPSADNKTFTVDLGTLAPNTTYNVKVSGVVDSNSNTVADKTFTFKTVHAGYKNLLADHDPGFEGGAIDTTKWNLSGTVTRTDAKAHTGVYSALSSGRSGGWNGPQAYIPLEENTQYLIGAWVYTDATGEKAKMRVQGADVSSIPDYTDLTAGQWNYVSAVIDTNEATDLVKPRFYVQTEGTSTIYVDDCEVVKVGKYLSSDKLINLSYTYMTIDIGRYMAECYSSKEDIANDIDGAEDYNVIFTDKDNDGEYSDGDAVTFVSKAAGEDYSQTFTLDVHDYYESTTEALIVKGSDGLGDDFCRVDTITKAGDAFIEYRVENNYTGSITPAVVAAVYDDNGKMISMDIADSQTIAESEYADFELSATIPSGAAASELKIMVWDGLATMNPLAPVAVYTIDTNDFTVPNVISDDMVLQRNATTLVFGKAPEGAVVTAELSGGTKGEYTVLSGDNEFFVPLAMDNYNAQEQTLTISAVDKNGESLGTVTRTGVLVGDVYYGGGQSNMQREFYQTQAELATSKQADYVAAYTALANKLNEHNVRIFRVRSYDTTTARDSLDADVLKNSEVWKTVDSSNIKNLNEVMCNMAGAILDLSTANSEVPIGIVTCAQGGTKLAKWVSRDALFSGAFDAEDITEYETNVKKEGAPIYWAEHTDLYYDGVRSVMPYTVKAAVWYQGESDTTHNYDKYLKAMINDMRAGMKNSSLPYLIVQLPGYESGDWTNYWPERRLLQWNVQQLDNVYTVVTNDTGDNANIHPANKVEIGERLARTILAKALGEDIAYTGPTYKSVEYGTGTATVTVDTYGGTLAKYTTTVGSPAFQLTTDGSTWVNADSITVDADANTITVSKSGLTDTVTGVRYAYAEGILKCIYASFADGAQLPLAPFDTTFEFTNLK